MNKRNNQADIRLDQLWITCPSEGLNLKDFGKVGKISRGVGGGAQLFKFWLTTGVLSEDASIFDELLIHVKSVCVEQKTVEYKYSTQLFLIILN